MYKKLLLFAIVLFSVFRSSATYVPIAVTGYNADVVANGTGPAATSAPQDVDGVNYAFMAADYSATGATFPTRFLPTGGLVTSAVTTTPGLTYQLASYSANNSLRLGAAATGTLTFPTAQAAGEVYVLATGGSGACNTTMTVTFTDATTQIFTGQTVSDWYGGTNYAIQGLGRVNRTDNSIDNNTTDPRLYQIKLTLLATNYTKPIASISFTNTTTGGATLNVMGVTINTPCSGAVTAGAAIAGSTTVCPAVSFNLTLPTATSGVGINYQWQSSTTGGAPWTTIAGATSATYAATQTVTTSYRAYVACGTGTADTSTPVSVSMSSITSCYCIPTSSCGSGDVLTSVIFGSINNPTACGGTSGYNDFTTTIAPAIIPVLTATPFTMTATNGGTEYGAVWIDYDRNGTFDASEFTSVGSGPGFTATVPITIPATALTGLTRMRVRVRYITALAGTDACTSYSFGETEDYLINIIPNTPCAAPASQPTALILTPAVTSVNGSFTAATPAADKYLVLRTPGTTTPSVAPVSGTAYTPGTLLGTATVVSYGSATTTFTDAATAPSTQYRYTIYAYNDVCVGGPAYNTTTPATATVTTNGVGTYTWTGAVSSDWQVAGNWTPFRSVTDPTDVLQFNNSLANAVTNIPTQTIGRLLFTNNTSAAFKAQTTAARTLTFSSDNNAATNELDIATGSSVKLDDAVTALALKFTGTGSTGRIAGTLEISNTGTGITNSIDFSNAIDTVTATGTLIAGGSVNTSVFTSTAANLVINGTYNHKYTTVGGGNIPTATWGTASNVLISGYTTATGGPAGGLGQTFNNFTYNAPLQTAVSQWSGTIPTTVNGILSVISTGTGQWQWATTTAYTVTANNFSQTGGVVDFGTSTGTKTINIAGNFNASAGILKVTGTGTVNLNFNGTAAAQTVSFFDSSVTGPVVYRVSNPSGINLSGTGLLATTPVFKINTGGGVQITSNAVNPVTTTLTLNYFATGTTLTYDGTNNQAVTTAIWPAANGPLNFTINNTGTSPDNKVTLPGSRTVGGTLTLSNGLLVLGANNLTVSNNASTAVVISSPSATKMIVADGAGQLIRAMGTAANTTYLYPVGDMTGTTEYSPVSLTVSSTGARLLGVRVVNAHHPSDASANYLNRYWVTTDTATSVYTYSGNFTYTAADITGTEASLRLSEWNGTAWAQIPSIAASGVLTIQGTPSSAFLPIGNMQLTGRSLAASNTYTWNGSVSTDYQVAGNWTPARNVPDPGDFLLFNNAIVDTVKNIPTQSITRLTFTNNTTGVFQTGATNTLTILSDNVTTTDELSIGAGSSIIANGTSFALNMVFGGTGATATIAGTFEAVATTPVNTLNFANVVATVTSTGTIAAGGTSGTTSFPNATATSLIMNGTYNHKYTTASGPAVPTASWNTGSTLLLSGYTTATGGPSGGLNQVFYNVTYNCPLQTSNTNWSGTGPLTATNNLSVISTGTTGTWQFSSTQGYTYATKNYIQTGGTVNLNSGTATATPTFNVSGDFNQTGGTFTSTGASTGANAPVINFNGTTVQNVNFFNAAPVGPITYRISNPAGINLTGTGTLTSAFNINTTGGVRISTAAANPINTTLALTYNAAGTLLTYDPTASATATAAVWPSTASPLNVTINTGGSANVLAVPFSRTIGGTLTMTSGDIDITSNDLTLGTAPASVGTLSYTAGNIRVTTGRFVRYYNTSGVPTAISTGAGYYPIASATGANRNVNLYFSTGTAFNTSGGSIAIGHTDASGLATVSVTDPLPTPYTITSRTNAAWNFTAAGVAGTGTIGVKISGQGLFSSSAPANLRVMQPAAVVGTHVAGSGFSATRTGLVVSDLTSPYHIGANGADMGGAYIAILTGNWSTPATWLGGLVPGVTNEAFINPGVTVTTDAATNTAKALTILPGGILTANSATSTVTIDSVLTNNGIVNVGGGTLVVNGGTSVITANNGSSGIINNSGATFNVTAGTATLGPVNGSFRAFNNSGLLNVTNGTLNVNGTLQLLANSTFNQSGGNINVDGNAGGIVANSVPSATPIVNILTPNLNLTAGTFTVVDPHVGVATNTFVYNTGTSVNASGTHTFRAGNGTSTDTGYNAAYGMSVNTNVTTAGKLALMNVIVNSGTAANSWLVLGATTGILGNFTINTGGEFRQGGTGSLVYLAGNLVNNGTYSALGTTYFGNYSNGTVASSLAAQSVTGTGTFRNLLTAPTGKFYKIQVNNNFNVTFNIGDVPFSNNVTMTASTAPAPVGPSRIIMSGNSILSELSGASQTTSATAGWVVGRYQKAAGTVGGFNGTFPVGDLNYYTPVNIGSATITTTGAIWASTTTLDHPAIATSGIAVTKSVNRYYTIQPVGGVVFATGATGTFNWNAADVDAGATPASFVIGKYVGTTWSYPTPSSPAATSIMSTALDLNVAGDYQIGEQCSPINIATQPANVVACAGSPATLSVGLTATANVTYQWQKGTVNIPGATSATYTIPATVTADAGTYRVVIGSACASVTAVTSATATLTINQPATITTQPVSQDICEGSPVTLTVAATGTGITYQWKKNGVDISSATASSYTITAVTPADATNYTVVVTGSAPCGSVTSTPAAITVKPLPLTITAAGPLTFCPGGSVVLNAGATTPVNTLTYQWRNGTAPLTGATSQSYTATVTGNYNAVITNTANGCSNTSNTLAVVTSGAPTATISPAGSAAFCQGGTVVLHGLNTPGLTYEWSLNGAPIPAATDSVYTAGVVGTYTLKVSIGAGCSTVSTPTVVTMNALPVITTTPSGAQTLCANDTLPITANFTSASLVWKLNGIVITPAATSTIYKATTAGNFTVTATSLTTGCVNTSAPVSITINPLPTVTVASSGATTFCDGGLDTLKASPVTGLTYVWNRNGAPVAPAATNANYTVGLSGTYTVTVTNTNGCKQTSTPTVITVNPLPNVIITPSLPLTMCQGQSNSLCVPSATGLTYQWKNNGANLTGATSACYAVTTAGNYTVTVTNPSTGCSATSSIAAIVVNPIPVATITNTGTGTACAGDTVCLNANTGTGLTYQWKLNGGNIVGAVNATYCATNSGNYSVTVTNASNCSVTSSIITMTFNPRPTATITYTTPVTFCEGGAVVLTGISNTGTTYQWQNNGTPIPGATNSNYISNKTGNYSVVITATNGCATVSPSIVVVVNPLPLPVITRANGILSTGSYATYQWYFNSTPIPGATNQSYNVTQNGGYAVAVTDANGCTNYSSVYFFNNVGVGGPQLNPAAIKIYPNPVHSVVNIDAPVQVNVVVRDLTGRLVLKMDNAKQLDMSTLADGAYMLMISDKFGAMIRMDKVMKVSE